MTARPITNPELTLEAFRTQLEQSKRKEPMGNLLARLPGIDERITEAEGAGQSLRRIRGMIDAMTSKERDSPDMLDGSRCRRIAAGAGVLPQDVERFLREFRQLRVLMKQMAGMNIWREGQA
jgi:signal recognition particle subunit SRP54